MQYFTNTRQGTTGRELLAAAITLLTLTVLTLAQEQPATDPTPPATARLRREGSRLEGQGTFRNSGDRWTFRLAEGNEQFVVLENQALERIGGSSSDVRTPWTVVATVTEYQGNNYLLILRAVRASDNRLP